MAFGPYPRTHQTISSSPSTINRSVTAPVSASQLFSPRGMPACLARGIRKGWLESNSDVIGDVAADHPPRIPQIGMKIEIVGYRKRPIGYLDGGEAIEFEPAQPHRDRHDGRQHTRHAGRTRVRMGKLERTQIAVAAMRLDTIILA